VSAFSGDISGLNELIAHTTTFNDYIHFRLFLHLMEEQPDFTEHPPTFAPQLARSYEWSQDHKVVTFHLRDDVFWTDGVPVTAEDVRWTWKAQTHPDVAWEGKFLKEKITDVEVVDPHTVRFHFSQVYPAQLIHANEGLILPKHAWSQLPFSEWRTNNGWFTEHLVTDGPFKLESWKQDEEIVLVRNEAYYEEGLPRLDRAVFRIVPDQTSQIAQVRAGNLDFISNVPPDDAGSLEHTPGLHLKSYWGIGFIFIAWNNESPLFSDVRVRQALTMGIDRQGIVNALWGQYARVATSPIVDIVWAHDDRLKPWPYDPQRARELLEEAGWKDTDGDGIRDKDGRPFRFEILNHTGNRQREDATVIAQEQLREIGVSARTRVLDIGTFIPAVFQGKYEAAVEGITMSTDLNLRYLFHSDQIEVSFNHARYRNPQVDELIDEAYRQKEQEDMAPYLMKIQELIHHDQPVTFLWFSKRLNVHSVRVRDVRSNLLSPWFGLRYWWIDPQR
jgi:peptide/nickel transport system substrate-binding protein